MFPKYIAEVSTEGIRRLFLEGSSEKGEDSVLKAARETPAFGHAIMLGILASLVIFSLTSPYTWDLTARVATVILNFVGVWTSYAGSLSPLYVRLMDGTVSCFHILLECSGLITVAVFCCIFTLTIGLLKGSLLGKIAWFILSVSVGLLWNINRLAIVIIIAYRFGLSTFSFVHYFLGPFIDFVWVVSMWSLGMSLVRKEEMVF